MHDPAEFIPKWAAAPGLTITHALEERSMSYEDLAGELQCSKRFVLDLVAGRERITSEVAERLAQSVGSTKRFWLAREEEYRKSLMKLAEQDPDLGGWVSSLPVKDMKRLGWIKPMTGTQAIIECMQFFGVSSVERWRLTFESAVVAAAFRSSAAFETNAGALSAWLRQGELQAAAVSASSWNPVAFTAALHEARALTRIKSPGQFLPVLQRLCSTAGVAVVVVPAPNGCRASGAARFLSSTRALIQLSQRYGTDDQFWFTFFHEAGHLLLHPKVHLFIDGEETNVTKEEKEANEFAAGILLTDEQRLRLTKLPTTYRDVIRFAREVGLAPGIVAGQLQHSRRVPFEWLNKAKRKLDWSDLTD